MKGIQKSPEIQKSGYNPKEAILVEIMSDEIIKGFLDLILPLEEHIEKMYLFGSRSRYDFRPDSDYDVLIVLKDKNREVVDRLYDAVIEILIARGRLISLKIFTVKEFNRLKSLSTPFITNVLIEGIKLGVRY